jgi:tyrosine decarboxylase/aspartate 1-decarboxylase
LADGSDAEVMDMQAELIATLSQDILKLPESFNNGLVLHSGSEANELAVHVARESTRKKIVIISTLTHSSVENACSKLGMKVLKLPVDRLTLQVKSSILEKHLIKYGDATALLVQTHGTTKLGSVTDIEYSERVNNLLTSKNIRLHIDAAYGGMLFSLIESSLQNPWKQSKALASLTIDPHKFIGALGCGVLLFKTPKDKNYLGEDAVYFLGNSSALGTTRSAYPLATSLAAINYYGLPGLKIIAETCLKNALFTAKCLEDYGWRLIIEPQSGVVPLLLGGKDEVERHIQSFLAKGFKISPIMINNGDTMIYGIRLVVTPKRDTQRENLLKFIKAAKSSPT